ncbi:MAG: chromosome partitioning protein, partial [Brachybacterium sp.]|nr:chromosome partitioning protein [Brachybacterium sp.]
GPSAPGPSAPDAASAPAPEAAPLPTLEDLRSASAPVEDAPATRGWQGFITRLTGRRIAPRPHPRELQEREFQARIRRPVDTSKNIVVVNLKGGAHKTTASLMIAATLGLVRGGSVVAWDNNETRGTLGWRGHQADHHATAVDLLHDMDELNSPGATVAQLDRYMRPQTQSQFDILASDDNPGSAAFVDASAFDRLNDLLSRFYRMKVIDTGNNVRASNWLAAVESADQLVIISTIREDTFNAAAWMIDELRATGYADKVDQAVTVLSQSSPKKVDPVLHKRLLQHFGAHTRAVHEVPFERQFVDGSTLDWSRISPATKNAWLAATASIVAGL